MYKQLLHIFFLHIRKNIVQYASSYIGMTFAIITIVAALYWILYETTFDSFYPESKHIYKVFTFDKESDTMNDASKGIEVTLRDQVPSIESSTAIIKSQENCKTKEIPYISLQLIYADSTFLSLFPQNNVCGDYLNPLSTLNNMVLTESMAQKLFGDSEKALGQYIQNTIRPDLEPYLVTAVVKDPPSNSNLLFDAIVNHDMLRYFASIPEEEQWSVFPLEVFVKTIRHADIELIKSQISKLPAMHRVKIELDMVPIQDIRHAVGKNVSFSLDFINLFVMAGILLMLASVFNFINFNAEGLLLRMKEFRMRYVHGASKSMLMIQMLTELFTALFIIALLSFLLVVIIRPFLINLLEIDISVWSMFKLQLLVLLMTYVLILLISIAVYFFISSRAILPFSGQSATSQLMLKRLAITMQLIVSILLAVVSVVMFKQMNFVSHKDLGFPSNEIVMLKGFQDYSGGVERKLINGIKQLPQVKDISDSFFEPQHETNPSFVISDVSWEGKGIDVNVAFDLLLTDDAFFTTMGLSMVDGTWWHQNQTNSIVLNEEAVKSMQLSDPIGKVINMPSIMDPSIRQDYSIIGVVKDFHTLSLRHQINPTIMLPAGMFGNILYVRTTSDEVSQLIGKIYELLPNIHGSLINARVMPMQHLYDELNKSEQVGTKLFSILTFVSFAISLVGVNAIAIISARKRRKEIAVRRVMGASEPGIVAFLMKEYVIMVVMASLIALPVSWIAMNYWLQGFAYRISITLTMLFGICCLVMFFVLLSVIKQVIKVSHVNLIDVLKSE